MKRFLIALVRAYQRWIFGAQLIGEGAAFLVGLLVLVVFQARFHLLLSFAAGLLQMRYIYSMPVERITKYFADNGFTLRKATANKLIARSADASMI